MLGVSTKMAGLCSRSVLRPSWCLQQRNLSTDQRYRLVIVGGGAGGCGTANKFASKLGAGQAVAPDYKLKDMAAGYYLSVCQL